MNAVTCPQPQPAASTSAKHRGPCADPLPVASHEPSLVTLSSQHPRRRAWMRFKRWTQSARPMDHRVWQARAWRLTRAIYTLQGCPSRGTKNNSRRWVYIGTPLLSASIDSRIETTVLEARQGESTRPYWNSAKIRGIFSIRLIPRQLGHPNWLTQVGSPTLF